MAKKKGLLRAVRWTGIVLLIICAVGTAVILKIQDRYIFYPNLNETAEAYLHDDENFYEVVLEGQEGELRGWLRPDKKARAAAASATVKTAKETEAPQKTAPEKEPLLICFGGTVQSSAGVMIRWEKRKAWKYFDGYNVLMVDYPGYGRSDGSPGEAGILQMAEEAYEYGVGLENVDPSRIAVMGYSLGTGPATYVASKYPVCGLVLVAPYDSMLNMYNKYIDIFHGPLELLVKNRLESVKYAEEVEVAPLIIASKGDEIIPYSFSEHLADTFPEEAELVTVDGDEGGPDGVVTHTMLAVRKETFKTMAGYLKECLKEAK